MANTWKIFKYSFIDLLRSKWTLIYIAFFLFTSFSLLYFSNDLPKAIVSLMNIVVVLVPLISTMLGVIYYYNIQEFIALLLSQPVKRSSVFLGQYLGLVCSLVIAIVIGIGVPFLVYGIHVSDKVWDFGMLLIVGILLSFIFSGIAFLIGAANSNKIKTQQVLEVLIKIGELVNAVLICNCRFDNLAIRRIGAINQIHFDC